VVGHWRRESRARVRRNEGERQSREAKWMGEDKLGVAELL
jgi:hypothetical protein